MKIKLSNNCGGNALVLTLMIGGILGAGVASYMGLVNAQYKSVRRSQSWNNAMPVIEAGLEEAMLHIHYNDVTNLGCNGWVLNTATGNYEKDRTLGNNRVHVSIRPSNPPVVTSQGYVHQPLSTNWLSPRTVQVTTTRTAMFAKGMVAKGQINLNGNNIRSDSFDSTDPNYSTGGRYDATKAKDNGDVATDSGLINSLNVGNANIYGKVSTGPGGSVSIGNNGAVGSILWQAAGNKGVQAGWSSDDMNVSFPPVVIPTATWTTPSSGTVGGVNYTLVFSNGFYKVDSLGGPGTTKYIVTGNAVLWVTNGVDLAGNDSMTISTNASIKMYNSGSSAGLAGNGVMNQTGNAMNFLYFGTTNNTSISFAGNAGFVGAIYAPNAAFQLNGGGNPSDNVDFTGSSITGTVQMNGHYTFHYDENLAKNGPSNGFVINGWNEI